MTDETPPAADPVPERPDAAATSGAATSGSSTSGSATSGPATSTDRESVTVRRSPRYGRFIVLGGGLGAVITFVLTNLYPIDDNVGFGALFGYFLLFGVPIGAALGGLLAVLLDALAARRATQLEIERERVESPPETVDGDLED